MSAVFSDKLDRLLDTIACGLMVDVSGLVNALKSGTGRLAIAVGSGGSAAAAEYLAICRASLGDRTIVQTPMQFVFEQADLRDNDVWIFSAKGENTDICAVLSAARTRGAESIFVVTSNPDGRLAREADAASVRVFDCPVADPKDGFLATHSLLAAVTALLRASDQCAANLGQCVAVALQEAAAGSLSHARRQQLHTTFAPLCKRDMLLLLVDPRLGPAATVLETSLWETAMLPVQRTDFRNFAHGRHVWLARKPDDTFVVALTGVLSASTWSEIQQLVSPEIRTAAFDYGSCGRFQNAVAVVEALTFIEAMGNRLDVDPAKPGSGTYAAAIYGSDVLRSIETRLDRPVRHKKSAHLRRNDPSRGEPDFAVAYTRFRDRLAGTVFQGLVLDYDGTIVSYEGRYCLPEPPLIDELVRLIEGGVRIGIATGRGGSVGEALRASLASQYHERVLVGYYNGSYIQTLDVDIREAPAPVSAELLELSPWLAERQAHFRTFAVKDSGAQISVSIADLYDPDALLGEFGSSFPEVQWARSAHTIDFFTKTASKADVVTVLAKHTQGEEAAILRVGDSGERYGNDHVLLGSYYGISVGQVCDRPDVCWSLFGYEPSGPEALLQVIKALIPAGKGIFRLDIERLRDSA